MRGWAGEWKVRWVSKIEERMVDGRTDRTKWKRTLMNGETGA